MRDLTEDEIREYFRFARTDRRAEDFSMAQTQLIGAAARESGLLSAFAEKALMAQDVGLEPEDMLLSAWVWAFQMGRECESRLITLALKTWKKEPSHEEAAKT